MKDTWIRTYTGKKFYPLNPDPENIDIVDIAHALSNVCRFTGHVSKFYSVAEHCRLAVCAYNNFYGYTPNTAPDVALEILMHDAAEAYIADISSPIKPLFSNYKDVEAKLEEVIFRKFGLKYPFHPIVKEIDNRMLHTEMKHLMNGADYDSNKVFDRLYIENWTPKIAEVRFLDAFYKLTAQ